MELDKKCRRHVIDPHEEHKIKIILVHLYIKRTQADLQSFSKLFIHLYIMTVLSSNDFYNPHCSMME